MEVRGGGGWGMEGRGRIRSGNRGGSFQESTDRYKIGFSPPSLQLAILKKPVVTFLDPLPLTNQLNLNRNT